MKRKYLGELAESHFKKILLDRCVPHQFVNKYYDFDVCNEKVEVKSCQLSVRDISKGKLAYRSGRYDFTKEKNRILQFQNNVWVCFIVRQGINQFVVQGFCRARKLKKMRYISIPLARKFDLISFDDWLKKVVV